MKPRTDNIKLSRRHALQILAAVGITGPAALEVLAQTGKEVSLDTLRTSAALIDADLSEEQLEVISKAIQKNIDQFETFRSLEIDDMIEPAPIFMAKGRV